MDQIKIGRFIAKLRKEQQMTQLDLATKIGVTDRAISKWENGRGLPDISLISPLCEVLGISIDELLEGERIESSQKLKVTHKNLLSILGEREQEKIKSKKLSVLISVLLITAIAMCVVITPMLYASLRGDGYSFSAAYATQLAGSLSKAVTNHNFSKAVKNIGFENQDRSIAEKEWVDAMENLSDKGFSIRQLMISQMDENDRFVSGNAMMIVYDYESDKKYVFDLLVAFQDGGISFGGPQGIFEDSFDEREQEIALLIYEALCTYYAG